MTDGTSIAATPRTSTPRRIHPGRISGTRPVQKFGTAWAAGVAALAIVALSGGACAQPAVSTTDFTPLLAANDELDRSGSRGGVVHHFRSAEDSLEWESARTAAERARGFRVVIGLFERRMWVLRGDDTLRVADVGVGMDSSLVWEDASWEFHTPRGRRNVRGKERNPLWVPPDWHYVETAQRLGLGLEQLHTGRPVTLSDGRRLVVRGSRVHLVDSTGTSSPLAIDEEIIFDGVLYIPPFSTRNRRIEGELGRFKLDLGQGYLIHGTPHDRSIGRASTHGCIRLADEDIEWVFRNVPVGSRVYIY